MNFETLSAVLGAFLILSEALGGNKSIAENSVYQLVAKVLKNVYFALTGKVQPTKL